jgi:hypothetical protein
MPKYKIQQLENDLLLIKSITIKKVMNKKKKNLADVCYLD